MGMAIAEVKNQIQPVNKLVILRHFTV